MSLKVWKCVISVHHLEKSFSCFATLSCYVIGWLLIIMRGKGTKGWKKNGTSFSVRSKTTVSHFTWSDRVNNSCTGKTPGNVTRPQNHFYGIVVASKLRASTPAQLISGLFKVDQTALVRRSPECTVHSPLKCLGPLLLVCCDRFEFKSIFSCFLSTFNDQRYL